MSTSKNNSTGLDHRPKDRNGIPYHRLSNRDQKRIRCQHYDGRGQCRRQAVYSEHHHFDTCGAKGISFSYQCPQHTALVFCGKN